MCIRDRLHRIGVQTSERLQVQAVALEGAEGFEFLGNCNACLLYTSDAADERSSVDLGGRRIIKKKITDLSDVQLRDMTIEDYVTEQSCVCHASRE